MCDFDKADPVHGIEAEERAESNNIEKKNHCLTKHNFKVRANVVLKA